VFAGILGRAPLGLTSTLSGLLRLLFKAAKGTKKMKIKRVVHHGKIRWRVNDPRGANGKRQRKFFETKAKTRRRRLAPHPE
jgi:hypothetical protein